MKTGIVFEIKDNKAVVMKNNGEFITVFPQKEWKKGDVVILKKRASLKNINFKIISGIAACFLLFISLSFCGLNLYFKETSFVSIDVNPSIELGLNCFDRVIKTSTYNEEGADLLKGVNLKNKTYQEALELLINTKDLSQYLKENSIILFAVQSENLAKEAKILWTSEKTATAVVLPESVTVEYHTVDENFVEDAHSHGVTPGKYVVLLALEEAEPTVDIHEYTHHSIEEIKTETSKHQSGHEHETGDKKLTIDETEEPKSNHDSGHDGSGHGGKGH